MVFISFRLALRPAALNPRVYDRRAVLFSSIHSGAPVDLVESMLRVSAKTGP